MLAPTIWLDQLWIGILIGSDESAWAETAVPRLSAAAATSAVAVLVKVLSTVMETSHFVKTRTCSSGDRPASRRVSLIGVSEGPRPPFSGGGRDER